MSPRPIRHVRFARVRLVLLTGGLVTLLLLARTAGPRAHAEPPPPTSLMSADDAEEADTTIALTPRPEGASTLIVAELPEPPVEAPAPALDAARLLDIAPAADIVLAADLVAGASGTLTIQHADGTQLLVSLPGIIDGELAPGGAWVAVIDGIGRLLRIDAVDGATSEVAVGPFLGPISFEPDGSLLLLGVSSVEAPWQSRLLRLDPTSGASVALSPADLVYGATLLDDGIAYAAHDHATGATVVERVRAAGVERIADLGPSAIEVDVAPDGEAVAYSIVGDGAYLLGTLDGRARRLGPGSAPRFSPDGERLAVRRGSGTAVLRLDGSTADLIDEVTVEWSDCSGECAS